MSNIPWFRQPITSLTFAQIWPDYASFKSDFDALKVGFGTSFTLKADSIMTTYYLLLARYGNSPITNSDPGQFKMKIMSVMYGYGPTWERKQEIQNTLRALSESDLLVGAKQIYNHAYNPSSTPSTGALDELDYINDQSTSNNKKSKMEAYSILWNILKADTTKEYVDKFKSCFSVFVDKMVAPFYIDKE